MPIEFIALNARRILWKDYGIVIPDFSGQDAIDAIRLNRIETQRKENLDRRRRPTGNDG